MILTILIVMLRIKVQSSSLRWVWCFELIWLVFLAGYVLAGTARVPFHGDESTIIWMSKDFGYIFLDGQLERVRYHEPPLDAAEQHLRLLNGSLSRYVMGFSWTINGYTTVDINEQWHWGFDWDWNVENGHIPDDTLLMLGRWPSALMLAASVFVLYFIGRRLGGIWTASITSLFFALHPAVLLQGRRAMFEGGTFLFTFLMVWFGLTYVASEQTLRWRSALGLGIATGLAISMKHTGIVTALAVGCGILIYEFVNDKDIRQLVRMNWRGLVIAGLAAFSIFYIFNPVWWHDPFTRARQVLEARSDLLATQVDTFGGYDGLADRIGGFFRQTFDMQPQYFEVDEWAEYIGNQIVAYESTTWDGVVLVSGGVSRIFLLIATLSGLALMAKAAFVKQKAEIIIVTWGIIVLLLNLVITPIEWQRYYLSGIPVLALSLGYLVQQGVLYLRQLLQRGLINLTLTQD